MPSLEIFGIKPKEQFIPNESWYKSYIEGNASWPQASISIGAKLLNAVLNDPPANWSNFTNSKFSSEQLDHLGMIMSRAHHARDVQYATKPHMENGDKKIKENRLQKLWANATELSTDIILNYIDWLENPTNPKIRIGNQAQPKEDIQRVNGFVLAKPESFGQLRSIVGATNDALLSPQALEIMKKYRDLRPSLYSAPLQDDDYLPHEERGERTTPRLDILSQLAEPKRQIRVLLEHSFAEKFPAITNFSWLIDPMFS